MSDPAAGNLDNALPSSQERVIPRQYRFFADVWNTPWDKARNNVAAEPVAFPEQAIALGAKLYPTLEPCTPPHNNKSVLDARFARHFLSTSTYNVVLL